jgi:hypothetical protein
MGTALPRGRDRSGYPLLRREDHRSRHADASQTRSQRVADRRDDRSRLPRLRSSLTTPLDLPRFPRFVLGGVQPAVAPIAATRRAHDALTPLELAAALRARTRRHWPPTCSRTREHGLTVLLVIDAGLLPIATPADAPTTDPLRRIPDELTKRTQLPTPAARLQGRIVEGREESPALSHNPPPSSNVLPRRERYDCGGHWWPLRLKNGGGGRSRGVPESAVGAVEMDL